MYKEDGPYGAYVDISRVAELHSVSTATPVRVGGAVTLTELQELLDSVAETHAEYRYGSVLAEHIRKIGSTPVRNVRIRFALNEIHLLLRTS